MKINIRTWPSIEARLNQIAKAEEFESMKKDIAEIKELLEKENQ